jgi:hypothetical protein
MFVRYLFHLLLLLLPLTAHDSIFKQHQQNQPHVTNQVLKE